MNTGGCFCGAVRYQATKTIGKVAFCHCSKCRKWHGHVGAYTATDRDAFKVTEARGLKWHQMNPEVRRGFCQECGSSLFFDQAGLKMGIAVGTLDEPTGLTSKGHIFVASKGDYYELSEDGLLRYDEGPP